MPSRISREFSTFLLIRLRPARFSHPKIFFLHCSVFVAFDGLTSVANFAHVFPAFLAVNEIAARSRAFVKHVGLWGFRFAADEAFSLAHGKMSQPVEPFPVSESKSQQNVGFELKRSNPLALAFSLKQKFPFPTFSPFTYRQAYFSRFSSYPRSHVPEETYSSFKGFVVQEQDSLLFSLERGHKQINKNMGGGDRVTQ